MFQTLLAERFKMAVHRETREVDGFALTVAKDGAKIEQGKADGEPPPLPEWFRRRSDSAVLEGKAVATIEAPGIGAITGRGVSMLQFSEALQRVLRVAVLDQTGLSGKYYFGFQFAQADRRDRCPRSVQRRKDLGLKLEKHKGPVEMLVVDHIERTPTEN
jgi:uncharacterized protein (TIGR03435 family)